MLDLVKDIDSLTRFKRETPAFVKRLKKSGRPMVLTVNGRAELIVQDAAAYQELLEWAERAKAAEALRAALESAERGEGQPVEEALHKRGTHR
jgi:PHD/YefM family antitoxin component YafN of YafNO toxin-antitoxin module